MNGKKIKLIAKQILCINKIKKKTLAVPPLESLNKLDMTLQSLTPTEFIKDWNDFDYDNEDSNEKTILI